MKTCNKCNQEKDFKHFAVDSRNKDGHQSICRQCKNDHFREKRAKAREAGGLVTVAAKTCNDCGTTKEASLFFRDSGSSDGIAAICKECKKKRVYAWRNSNRDKYNEGARAWGQKNPEKRYGHEIKRRYGCALEQYNEMLVKQEGACAICKCLHNPAVNKGRLFVDHCHTTGGVRGLLCSACNSILGLAKDDPRILLECVAYLTRHKTAA